MTRPTKSRLAPRSQKGKIVSRSALARARERAPEEARPTRRDRDEYLTPVELATALCQKTLAGIIPAPARIVEPSAGTGNFIRGAKAAWPEAMVMAVDTHQPHGAQCHAAGAASFVMGDWLAQDVRGFKPDLITGNPPFSDAEKHIKHALAMLEEGKYLAFLLPVTFDCGQGRARNLWGYPPPYGWLRYTQAIAQRPSFTSDGQTDMTEYAFYVWQKGFDSLPTKLPHLWWR